MKNSINIKSKENITFGVLFFILFLIIGLYPLKSDGIIRIWSVSVSLVFLFITIIKPNLFTFVNKLWIQFGYLLGKFTSPIILAVIFFVIIYPIGILMRSIKENKMNLKFHKNSYWINRKDKIESMKKQF
jgi:hypothetical protein